MKGSTDMDDRRLIRLLHGELDAREARAIEAELARDPALRARLEHLQGVWEALQPAPPTPAPYGFAERLRRQVEARRAELVGGVLGWGLAPSWARALAGAALLAGVALGLGLGRLPAAVVAAAPAPPPQVAPATPAAPPPLPPAAHVGGSAPSVGGDAAAPPAVAGVSEEAAPLTGEATFAEEYWQALAGGGESDSGARDGAG